MANGVRKRRRWLPWAIAVVVLAGVAVVLTKRGGAGPKEIDSSLITKVKRGDLAIEVIETGKVQPLEKVEVKSKVPGQVLKVMVDAGAHVKKGQLLLVLDPVDYRRDVAKTEADVASAKNALEFSQLSLDRRQRGFEQRGVAQIDVDTALSDLKAKKVAEQLAEVAFNKAQDQLHYTQIVAPLDGTVTERNVQPGETVVPGVQATMEGKPLMIVSNLSTLLVKADLNQIDVAKVRLGQKVALTLDALPGKTYTAKITKIAPAATTPKGKDVDVFPVEATLDGADDQIKPGMTADMRVHIETRKGVLSLPIEAVVKEAAKQFVTKVTRDEKGKPHTDRVEVKVGARNDREVEVTDGIKEGDQVLIRPNSSADNEYKM